VGWSQSGNCLDHAILLLTRSLRRWLVLLGQHIHCNTEYAACSKAHAFWDQYTS
jgi:hypothetical protein